LLNLVIFKRFCETASETTVIDIVHINDGPSIYDVVILHFFQYVIPLRIYSCNSQNYRK